MDETDRYSFITEWYDPQAAFIRRYTLSYFPKDGTVEMYDLKNRKMFLRRTQLENVQLSDLFIGNSISVLSRQLKITDFADEYSKMQLGLKMERTLAFIKPDAIHKVGQIMDVICQAGFTISQLKMCHLSRNEAFQLLQEHQHRDFFNDYIVFVTSGPVIAMELMGNDAIGRFRSLLGPTDSAEARGAAPLSIRARFGTDFRRNACHGSDSPKSAAREIEFFFPLSGMPRHNTAVCSNSTCCVVKPHAVLKGYSGSVISRIQEQFAISAMLMVHMEQANAEEFYEVYKTVLQEYPEMVTELVSGPCIALEIRPKPGSEGPANVDEIVKSFRNMAGPSDPEVARHLRSHTLRAQFGENKIRNGIHCTDLPEDGQLEVEYFFKVLDH